MSWNGLGTYVLTAAAYPEVNGTVIDATRYNALMADIATGINNSVAKNGENVPLANLPMGGYKHTGAANASAAGQYLVFNQDVGFTDGTEIGYRNVPVVSVASGAQDFALTSRGKASVKADAATMTVRLNSAVAFPLGTMLVAVNNSSGNMSLAAEGGVTLRLAGTATTGTRTIAQYGYATLMQIATDVWVVTGPGVS